jgi:Xaa-Pro aminopeptidase
MRKLAVLVLFAASTSFALEKQPTAEYHARRVALAAKLHGGAALLFGNDEPREEYQSWRQDEDFYYLTGWNEPGAALLIESAYTPPAPPSVATVIPTSYQVEPYRGILFLPERNLRLEQFTGVKLDAHTPDAAKIAGVDEVRQLSELPAELVRMTQHTTRRASIYTGGDDAKANAALTLLGVAYSVPPIPAQPIAPFTRDLRSFKSAGELDLLRKASDASNAAHRALFAAVHDGASERAVSGLIDEKLKENGCERPSYPSIVGSGIHSTELHYMEDDDTMDAGDLVVIDAAGEYSMYASDITRTLPISGHFTPRQREIYGIVLGAQRAAQAAFVSGKSSMGSRFAKDTSTSLDEVAFEYINTHGHDLHGQPLGKYFIHGLGHSVGIDVHDPFDYTKPFGPGAVFTIEPGIYIPEEKIGVRIEDTFYVDQEGKLISFQASLPHTADEVEAAMTATQHTTTPGKSQKH